MSNSQLAGRSATRTVWWENITLKYVVEAIFNKHTGRKCWPLPFLRQGQKNKERWRETLLNSLLQMSSFVFKLLEVKLKKSEARIMEDSVARLTLREKPAQVQTQLTNAFAWGANTNQES